jgi:16S rRNA (guanine527-N7)-methyltransferase
MDSKTIKQILFELSKKITGIIDEDKIKKCLDYFYFLEQENKIINLISRKSTHEDILYKHFLSSFLFVKYINIILQESKLEKILDIGSGGGFPAIICSIYFPSIKFYLLDSIGKKTNFLLNLSKELNLANTNIIHGRAEEIYKNKIYYKNFDMVTSRATANIPLTVEYSIPFLKTKGYILTIKSIDQINEFLETKEEISRKFNINLEYFTEDENIIIKSVRV